MFPRFIISSSDPLVVDPVPTAGHWFHFTVALTKPVNQPKKVTAKGKEVAHLATRLQVHKVTWLTSLSPEVTIPAPRTAGPSGVTCPPLFEETALSSNEDIGGWEKGAPKTSGE